MGPCLRYIEVVAFESEGPGSDEGAEWPEDIFEIEPVCETSDGVGDE